MGNILTDNIEVETYFNTKNNVNNIGCVKYNIKEKKYYLTSDIIILDTSVVQIQLNAGESFNGNNHKITHYIDRPGLFIINNSSNKKIKIKNLNILFKSINALGGDFGIDGGIVSNTNRNFHIYNCNNYSVIHYASTNSGGGLCGNACTNFIIEKCTNYGVIYGSGSGGICGSSCDNFIIKKCTNYGLINNSTAGGISGDSCTNFNIIKCENFGDLYVLEGYTSQGGIVGAESSRFNIIDCINNGLITSASSGGIVGPDCSLFNITNCINNSNIFGGYSGGIIGQNCYDFNLYKCTNNGIVFENSSGIIGYQCGAITYSKMKIIKCNNYGDIIGLNSSGICGNHFFNYVDSQGQDIHITFYKCNNYGKINSNISGGVCGPNLMDTTSQNPDPITLNNYKYKLKLIKCNSKYGNLIGSDVFNTNTLNTNPYPPREIKIIKCKYELQPFISYNTSINSILYLI